jgi:alpha-L-fucosidase
MKHTLKNHLRRLGATLLVATSLAATAAAPVDMNQRAEELKSLKWGMFICWSFSTFSGKEWTPGITDVSFFKATGVDTDQWAKTAKEAGMGYILFLTKHHDGFCLWDTKTTDRKVTNAPLGRDVLAELKKSCDKHGIKLALYFSEGEWRHPGGLDQPDTTGEKANNQGGRDPEMKKAQLKELLTQYGPVEYIWFDHAVGDGGLSHADTVAFCKALQPGCFIGFNHGDQEGTDIRLGEMGKPGPLTDNSGAGYNKGAPSKSYRLAEFTYPILPAHDGGAMWFYSLPKHDGLCKPAKSLYQDYLGAVKYGNVFALNVGPNYEGKLRDIDVATLRKIGAWIRDPSQAPQPPLPALSSGKPATASSSWDASYGPNKASDNDADTRWAAAPDTRSGWLEVDLGKDELIGRVEIVETSYPRTEEFAIEYKAGNAWKELARGKTIGEKKEIAFPPAKARYIRLNILKANEVPTINEFRVLPPKP